MLRTTNPDVVKELDPNRDMRSPYVGQMVLFHARPGEAYGGYQVLPALVIRVLDEDHIDLRVEGPDESIFRINIPRKNDQNIFHAWTFTAHDEEHYLRQKPAQIYSAEDRVELATVPSETTPVRRRQVRRAD
jgi:hypothetical protein